MSLDGGRATYEKQHGTSETTDLKTLATASKVGLGRVRLLAERGDPEAKEVLKALNVQAPDPNAAYDA